ncbi:protein-glutamate O-methyltransferase CheR [Amycolatopsis sp. NPDC051128]|uniref:protein-glutamate O-methyltransferase CheR n=1 Tax=Amycolatopsis sp. NPDC051128 TaxID=3155412 RepID=UPI00342DAA80
MTGNRAIEPDVDRVAELLGLRIGLRPESSVSDRLSRGVHEEMAARGIDGAAFLDILRVDDNALQSMVDRVTVQETSFFRHPEHFEILAREILPTLRPPVRIWSAACSNGQEAFSLAMLLDEHHVDGAVIATDLSTAALRRTTAAQYTARELTGLSADRLKRHLTRTGDQWEINKPIQDRVTVFRHNLVHAIPAAARGCQVVFCRNVLIYFSPQHSREFLDRLADALPPGAALFVSSAETIWQVTDRFDAVKVGESFVHRVRPAITAVPRPVRLTSGSSRRPVRGAGDSPVSRGAGQKRPQRPAADREQPPVRSDAKLTPDRDDAAQATLAAKTGQAAVAAGDGDSAVVAFRRWTYLAPDDAMAHLNLGLALDAAGDQPSARRAYGAARRAMVHADPTDLEHAMDGYAPHELLRFLDAKK